MSRQFFNLRVRAVLYCLVLGAAAACGGKHTFKNERTQKPDAPGFPLTIPQDHWEASSYCGKVRPEVPKDPTPPYRFEVSVLNAKLKNEGLTGWIHGAVPSYEQYVFTYRKEVGDHYSFFESEQFSLVPQDAAVAQTLATLKRHDKVRLKGHVFENGSPLTHVMVTGVELIKKYDHATNNNYTFDLAQLQGQRSFHVFGIVHATIASETHGRAIVVEHEDLIMPLAVPSELDAAAAQLYRGDIVNVAVKVVEHPHGPPHFEVDGDVDPAAAIEVVDPMLNCHGVEKTVTGFLTKFEQSPAISMDVYAVRVVDANGIGRNFTLFPSDTVVGDARYELLGALMDKAKAAWDSASEQPAVVRNFWKKESIKVTVKGTLNVVSSEQANAQVFVKSLDDLTLNVE